MQPGLRFEGAPPPTPPAKPGGNSRPFPLTVAELHKVQDSPPRGGGDALVAFRLLNDVIGKPGDRAKGAPDAPPPEDDDDDEEEEEEEERAVPEKKQQKMSQWEALAVRCRATNPDELRTEIRAQWPLSLPSLAGGGQPLEGQGAAGDAAMQGDERRWVHSTSAPLPLREDNVLDAKGSRPAPPEVEEKPQMDTSLPASGVAWKELPRDAVLRDETTALQEACISERERRWGGQLPPEQVQARRHRKIASALASHLEQLLSFLEQQSKENVYTLKWNPEIAYTEPPPAFFRTCVVSATPEDARRASRRRAIEKELLHEARAADAEEQEWTIWPSGGRWPVPSRWPAHILKKPDSGPRGRPFAHCGRGPTAAAVGVPRLRRTLRDCCSYDGYREGPDKLQGYLGQKSTSHNKRMALYQRLEQWRCTCFFYTCLGDVLGSAYIVDRGRPFAREAAVPVAIDVAVKTRGVVARLAMGEGERPNLPHNVRKAQVRTGTLVPLVADLVVKQHEEGIAAGSMLAPPKPSAWRLLRELRQKPKASKGSELLSRLRGYFWRGPKRVAPRPAELVTVEVTAVAESNTPAPVFAVMMRAAHCATKERTSGHGVAAGDCREHLDASQQQWQTFLRWY